ncbi:hypothetical protein NMY22_g19426 [Coprinellus aureogranulatus]|nr:hypothetical protein NMY22_g19426 [Coprinellus aureogranulatus]
MGKWQADHLLEKQMVDKHLAENGLKFQNLPARTQREVSDALNHPSNLAPVPGGVNGSKGQAVKHAIVGTKVKDREDRDQYMKQAYEGVLATAAKIDDAYRRGGVLLPKSTLSEFVKKTWGTAEKDPNPNRRGSPLLTTSFSFVFPFFEGSDGTGTAPPKPYRPLRSAYAASHRFRPEPAGCVLVDEGGDADVWEVGWEEGVLGFDFLGREGVDTVDPKPYCPLSCASGSVFSRTDKATDSEFFYNLIIEVLEDPDEYVEVVELLRWWNQQIFPAHQIHNRAVSADSVAAKIKERRRCIRNGTFRLVSGLTLTEDGASTST